MNGRVRDLVFVGLLLFVAMVDAASYITAQTDPAFPHYFIAIHCEPKSERAIPDNYLILQEMVAYADEYNMKLTIMFTPQWADYIVADSTRLDEVQAWMANGHEVAAHHHSIFHGSWDGYTDFSQEEVEAEGNNYRWYLGTLNDYMDALYRVNPELRSGCVNDEQNKQVMPDAIVYDTCSGFGNMGEPEQRLRDGGAEKGINEYVTVGTVNGIQRTWLTHFQVPLSPQDAMAAIDSMDGGIYGVATHAIPNQDRPLYLYMDFLHERDPEGARSRTVETAIEEQLIPEVELSDEVINTVYTDERPMRPDHPCGDGICDEVERTDLDLCPQDCD